MGYNILIVDDSAITRKAIMRIIGMVSELDVAEIFEADNGLAALQLLNEHHFDLVLADLNMPEMDGMEMVHQMQQAENTESIPVVIISSKPNTASTEELLADGIRGYLHKPFTPEDFREIITNTLGAVL
ncbi:MAG: response regulator [Planctomycetes bacterium]|nr:response regulator [Planctomycetota bacterium]